MKQNPSVLHFPPVFRRQQLTLATATYYLWPAPITPQDLVEKMEFICGHALGIEGRCWD